MGKKRERKIRKVLKGYNYWRRILGLSFQSRQRPFVGGRSSQCQVACHSDPCSGDPTCNFG